MSSDVAPRQARLTPNEARLVNVIADAAQRRVSLTRTEVGELSGYGTGEAARVSATRALSRPHVRAALMEAAAGILAEGAPDAAAMLRHVVNSGRAGERLTASLETLKLLGMGASEAPAAGNIAVQVVMPAELGALLTQARAIPSHVVEHQGVAARDHRPDEAGGEDATPPRGARKTKAKRGGRGRKRAPGSQARAPRTISPPPADVSGGGTGGE